MRVIIAGGRDFCDFRAVLNAINESGFKITEVVSGACRRRPGDTALASGADGWGEFYAVGLKIPYKRFYASTYGAWPGCGPRRNAAMAEYADALIAMPGGNGTANMIDEARKRGLKVYVAKP